MRSATAAFAASVLLLVLFATDVLGQRQRSYLFHGRVTDHKVHGLTPRVLRSLGGVFSLADELKSRTGDEVSVRLEHDDTRDYPGHIVVRRPDAQLDSRYRIDYASLVPMAMFVDSGATSLYTLFNADPAGSDFFARAGLLPHPERGHVALEFAGTPYAAALQLLDTCRDCLGNSLIGVPTKLDVGDVPDVVDWVNADDGLTPPGPYVFAVRDGAAEVSGKIVRFELRSSLGEVLVSSATEVLNRSDEDLEEAYFLFETVALLRAAKKDDPNGWARFRDAISSDAFVQAHPQPWELYTRSFCDAYPNGDNIFDCSGW